MALPAEPKKTPTAYPAPTNYIPGSTYVPPQPYAVPPAPTPGPIYVPPSDPYGPYSGAQTLPAGPVSAPPLGDPAAAGYAISYPAPQPGLGGTPPPPPPNAYSLPGGEWSAPETTGTAITPATYTPSYNYDLSWLRSLYASRGDLLGQMQAGHLARGGDTPPPVTPAPPITVASLPPRPPGVPVARLAGLFGGQQGRAIAEPPTAHQAWLAQQRGA
jgi:hypothetical protein